MNTAIVLGVVQGIVRNHNSNLLTCNGGHIFLGKPWAKNLLSCMGYIKRWESTSVKITVSNFEEQFSIDVKAVIEIEEIPAGLIINWDQIGINYVPTNS